MTTNGRHTDPASRRAAAGAIVAAEEEAAAEEGRARLLTASRTAVGVDGFTAVEPFWPVATRTLGHPVGSAMAAAAGIGAVLGALALLGLPVAAGTGRTGDHVLAMAGACGLGWILGAAVAPSLATARGRVLPIGAALVALALVGAGTLSPLAGFVVAGMGAGIVSARVPVVVSGLHPAIRVRGLAVARAAAAVGVAGAAIVVASAAFGGLGVMAAFLALAALVGAGAAYSAEDEAAANDPLDVLRLRRVADDTVVATAGAARWIEDLRRLWSTATVRTVVAGQVAGGILLVAWHVHVVRFLTLEWGLGTWGRGAVYAAVAVAAAAGIWVWAHHAEGWYRQDPDRLGRSVGASFGAGGIALLAVAGWPGWGGTVILVVGLAGVAIGTAGLDVLLVAAVRPSLRVRASALSSAALGAGLVVGAVLLRGIEHWQGTPAVLGAAGAVAVLTALGVRRPGASTDLSTAALDEVDAAVTAVARSRQEHLPLLACRNIDFSYGSVQVLFGVDFTVDEGEMVALLGTNGAGKSTLLRVVSGLGTPSRGSVRLAGENITYLDPAARVGRGISQVPGGKAVFGPLSVVENLRVYGYSLGRDRRAVDAGIEASFDAFPRLAERRNAPSQVLSGGERQMLALSKALILEPRLLLIDELSLGLAPAIVGQLLDMVRRLNEQGTAIVLVEQSVNVALSLVDHAYYMEKGEVRFDGPAAQLLERGDLLRSAYLEGAAKGFGS